MGPSPQDKIVVFYLSPLEELPRRREENDKLHS